MIPDSKRPDPVAGPAGWRGHAPAIAVIGAGMAGLACADCLTGAGYTVTVFDKGRSRGGRLASRVRDGVAFDHGAQFVTARGQGFRAAMDRFLAARSAAIWPAAGDDEPRYVGVPHMADLAAPLAQGMDVRQSCEVGALRRDGSGWFLLTAADTALGPFDAVLVTAPAAQAADLLRPHAPGLAARAATATYSPCCAAMIAAPGRADAPAVVRPETGPIGWACRNETKPGRPAPVNGLQYWVVHARPDWSEAHLSQDKADLVAPLRAALEDALGTSLGTAVYAAGHRWRYALVKRALGQPCLYDAALGLGAAGDWCLGGRVEAAFDSGRALAAEYQIATAEAE